MKMNAIYCAIFFALITTLLPVQEPISPVENEFDIKAIGLPVIIRERHFINSRPSPWWTIAVILSKENYSKENLEKIFSYYSEKYPDKWTILRVNVYGDAETYERYMKTESFGFPADPIKKKSDQDDLSPKDRWNTPHATYERVCYNEFYYYSTDLENPDKREKVILKGKSQTLTVIPHDCK